MSDTVDQSFRKQFEDEVKLMYQRLGSKLRKTVRRRADVKGASTTFQRIGKGSATTKARHGIVTPMNVDHTPVECVLQDFYAGDWVDKFDEMRAAHHERRVLATAGAHALGRKSDELIIAALAGATAIVEDEETGLTKPKVLDAFGRLGDADVFEEGRMFAVVGWKQWTDLLGIAEFANADYVGAGDKKFAWLQGTEARRWLGTTWIPHSGLAAVEGVRRCYWYHEDTLGHGVGAEIKSDVTWHGDRAAWFVNSLMSQGACLIDAVGVVRIDCDESAGE